MGEIRVVGRARGGRCVYCHDALAGEVRRCGDCAASWHSDCGAGASRCPTIGCRGPAPDARQRPPAGRGLAKEAEPRRVGQPGLLARVGPYSRLVTSALFHLAVVALVLLFFGWVLTHPATFWEMGLRDERGATESFLLLKALAFVFMPFFGWHSVRRLRALPGIWKDLGHLLASTTPTAMLLRIYSTGSGGEKRWYAALHPPGGGTLDALHTIQFGGLLPPYWLRWQDDRPVLVYGLPPPGPYVFEFEDGWLALVHPDED